MAKTIERFEELEVWKLAMECANLIYDVTSTGKFSRDYVLRDQIRRAAVSIFSNIAEGFERDGNKEFSNFLSIARIIWRGKSSGDFCTGSWLHFKHGFCSYIGKIDTDQQTDFRI